MRDNGMLVLMVILAIIVMCGGIAISIAILNSDLPDIWKWFLLR